VTKAKVVLYLRQLATGLELTLGMVVKVKNLVHGSLRRVALDEVECGKNELNKPNHQRKLNTRRCKCDLPGRVIASSCSIP